MTALDVLHYGHQTLLAAADGLPEEAWETPGVVGVWSTKDILAHLASFELVLWEVLASLLNPEEPTPTLDAFRTSKTFNDDEVARRRAKPPAEVLAEYSDAHADVMALAEKLPKDRFRQPGTLPWYGMQYDLDDFIVYSFYGHKREHAAQLAPFKKRLGHQEKNRHEKNTEAMKPSSLRGGDRSQ